MKKVLLIEDDDIIRNNTEEILKLAQYDVLTANNGKLGSELAIKHNPDIIICDILMPKLDGFGVLYVLSRNKETASIPFIFLSAKTQKSDVRKGMDLGADDYLCKPFDDNDLLSAIETRLKKHKVILSNEISSVFNPQEKDENVLKKFHLNIQKKHLTKYKKREIVYHSTDIAQYLYLLKEGRLKAFKIHDDGKEYITRVFKPGDMFGYSAIFTGTFYKDSIMALEESQVYKISKQEFLEYISSNRFLLNHFVKLLSGEIVTQEDQLLSLAYNSVRKRTAQALLLLLEMKEGDEEKFSVSIARDDLASLAGTAVETVIRCLSEFREDGLISTNKKEIIILKKDSLLNV